MSSSPHVPRKPRCTAQSVKRHAYKVEALESRRLLSVNVLTYHNDTNSDGVNSNEIQLTAANVKTGTFGKLYATALDGQVYAQPLVDTGVTVGGGVHNIVVVATENDSLYAIDSGTGAVLWQRSFLTLSNSNGILNNTLGATSISPVASADVSTQDITPNIGITGTPVIDSARNLIYLVAKTKEVVGGTTYVVQRLHAIKIADGTDATAPFVIGATSGSNTNTTSIYVYGTGDGSVADPYNGTGKGVVQFNALRENQRAAVSLVNNTVYVSWASHGDNGPYHGWVCTWNVSNVTTSGFALSGVLNTCPNNGESGVWQGGGSLVFEPGGGAFYFLTGNGSGGGQVSSGLPSNGNYNESLVKATADPTTSPTNQNTNGWGLKVVDFFSPYNTAALDGADSDFGSGAPVLIPNPITINGVSTNVLVVGGKDGRIFVLNRNNLGGRGTNDATALNAVGGDAPAADGGTLSAPAWYNGHLYVIAGYGGSAYEYSISSTGSLSTASQTALTFGYEPGGPSVSANGTSNGIVWLMDRQNNELHAYDTNSLNTELWNSSQAAGGTDNPGALTKFSVPTVANGEVFVGTSNSLVVYGLTPPATGVPQTPVLTATALSGSAINLTWIDSSVAPNKATVYLIQESTDGTNFTQVTTAPAGATSIGIGGLNTLTKYYFRIVGTNNIGNSPNSNVASATTTSQTTAVSFPTGFASAGGTVVVNGSATVSGSNLQLTDGNGNEAGSAFYSAPVNVSQFTTQFTFQLTSGNTADGLTFTLQNGGTTALGAIAGGLGYQGITNSVAIKFDLYNNFGEGPDSTGLFSGGAAPTNVNSIDLSSTGINLHGGDPIQANLSYNGTTLTVTLTDTATNATATQNYTVNIPSLVGGTTAYAGFTAGTGGLAAVQSILNWTYGSGATTSPNAPTGLGATPATATSVSLNWTNNALNQTGYHLDRATDAAFTQNLITETLPGVPASFTDITTGLAPGGTYYYRIRAFNSVGDSGNSNAASVTIPVAPAKATNQVITGVSTTEIDMSWQDNAGHSAQGYNILRAVNGGTFSVVATLPPTSRQAPSTYNWSDTTVTPGNFYEYHIQAYNTSGYNDFAGLNATTLTLAPAGLTAVPGSNGVTVSWSAVTAQGGVTYNLYRGTSPGGESSTPLRTGINATSYVDALPPSGTVYYYQVTAVNTNASHTPPLPSESARSTEAATSGPVQLTGTPSANTTLSYDGVSTYLKAFDGNTNTVFDAPTANGNWVQLDLGAAATISSISYAPRVGYESRMTGGAFQASNDPTFATGVVTLYTVPASPADGLTNQPVTPGAAYRYVRYTSPAGSYGNIAEMQVFGPAGTGATGTAPVVNSGPNATLNPAGTIAALAISASETGNPALTYTWSVTDLPDEVTTVPTFSTSNGTTSGNTVTASFGDDGTYGLSVTIADASGHSIVVPLSVTVPQVLTNIQITPNASPVSVPAGSTHAFTGTGMDQFGENLDTNPTYTWAIVTGGSGSINSATGVYTATGAVGTTATVTATAQGPTGTVIGSVFITTTAAASSPVQLTGTPSANTTLSYDGVSTYLKAFDGNTNTVFDAPTANGNWVQLDLGAAATISSISYAPRVGYESRMTGGAFQASNDPTFATGVVTLYTVPASPADGLTNQPVTPGAAYRYVRYTSPAGSYGNIAEMQAFGAAGSGTSDTTPPGTPGTPSLLSATTATSVALTWAASTDNVAVDHYIVLRNGNSIGNSNTNSYTDNTVAASTTYTYSIKAVDTSNNVSLQASPTFSVTTPAASGGSTQLTGAASANTTASYDGVSNYLKAFDGNTNTFFDAPASDGNWIQLDLGAQKTITQIAYAPRVGLEARMFGGIFEASNDATFATGVVPLYTVSSAPVDGITTQTVNLAGTYRYIRYVAPAGSYGNIAEMQVFGSAGNTSQLTGAASANTTGSYDGVSNYLKAFDGNTNTFFDAPASDGNWIQLDLGAQKTITQIAYAPRVGLEARMFGGIFEASNDATFATGVVPLYTVSSAPVDGITTQTVNLAGTYRYIRYVAPAGSYGNIAEMQVFGH